MDSFIRPGCTHVTVMALLCPAEHDKLCQSGAKGVASQLLQRSGGEVWAADMLVSGDRPDASLQMFSSLYVLFP